MTHRYVGRNLALERYSARHMLLFDSGSRHITADAIPWWAWTKMKPTKPFASESINTWRRPKLLPLRRTGCDPAYLYRAWSLNPSHLRRFRSSVAWRERPGSCWLPLTTAGGRRAAAGTAVRKWRKFCLMRRFCRPWRNDSPPVLLCKTRPL